MFSNENFPQNFPVKFNKSISIASFVVLIRLYVIKFNRYKRMYTVFVCT